MVFINTLHSIVLYVCVETEMVVMGKALWQGV